ncbi:MAG: TIGR04282 family arsenosugar biosynthesis glycosyltransferase [Bacteroidota bacterium]
MSVSSRSLLLIFVKHPVAGQSKTRLAAGIGHEKALAVYQDLLMYTARQVTTISQKKTVYYGNFVPDEDLWAEAGYPRFLQEGTDLGERMWHAFQHAAENGYERIVIIGSDCPGLTSDHLEAAFSALDDHDAVLGPALDGGYYLLGLKKPDSTLFLNKTWSTDDVAARTRRDFAALGWTYQELATLNDVDTVEDLVGTFLEPYANPAR